MDWTGLAALVWDASGGDEPQRDHDFIKAIIEANPGPALDVGCGTGRLLLRYLEAGLDVDGIDSSADMIALCREKAQGRGLNPALYVGYMQELDLPRRYRTIYIPCGTFCLVTDRAQAFEALRRLYNHLESGGLLVFNLFWPFADGEPLSPNRLAKDENWNPMFQHTLPDGRRIEQHMRLVKLDRVEQLLLAERRYRLYDGEQLVAEEVFNSSERWYGKYEMLMMLEKTGFREVQVKGDYTDADFAEGHEVTFYMARK